MTRSAPLCELCAELCALRLARVWAGAAACVVARRVCCESLTNVRFNPFKVKEHRCQRHNWKCPGVINSPLDQTGPKLDTKTFCSAVTRARDLVHSMTSEMGARCSLGHGPPSAPRTRAKDDLCQAGYY